MHWGNRKALDARRDAELRLIERGFALHECDRLLHSRELATAHVAVLGDMEREDVRGNRRYWREERQRWRAIQRETIARLASDPTGRSPRPGLSSVEISRELRGLRALA